MRSIVVEGYYKNLTMISNNRWVTSWWHISIKRLFFCAVVALLRHATYIAHNHFCFQQSYYNDANIKYPLDTNFSTSNNWEEWRGKTLSGNDREEREKLEVQTPHRSSADAGTVRRNNNTYFIPGSGRDETFEKEKEKKKTHEKALALFVSCGLCVLMLIGINDTKTKKSERNFETEGRYGNWQGGEENGADKGICVRVSWPCALSSSQ